MNTKYNKRYKSNSKKIEETFLALMYNHTYEEITISKLCEKAGINRSTFYAHYDDINDLIIKIESRFANSMTMIFDYGQKQTHEAFVDMFRFVKENKVFYKAFLNIPYATHAETSTKSNVLNKLKENNDPIAKNDVELFYRASFFGAGIKELCRIWISRDCKETPEQMARLLLTEYTNRP